MRVWLLGPFRVEIDGRRVDDDRWRLRKAKQLVKMLALAPDGQLPRDRVLELLWPGLELAAADNSYRQTVFVARGALADGREGGVRFFQRSGDAVALCRPGELWTDIEAVRTAARSARRSGEIRDHEDALTLFTGDLLPEDIYEDWPVPIREELRELRLSLLTDLGAVYEAAGRRDDAIRALEDAVTLQPTHEPAHVALMRIHAASGARRRALRQYEILSEALRAEIGSSPEPATRQLRDRILAENPTPPSGIVKKPPRRHNLPAVLTTFVGRERELSEIRALATRGRLLTLFGPPGAGKSRLALAVAEGLLDVWRHGVWWVELAALRDANDVPAAVLSAMGAGAQRGAAHDLVSALRDRELLLVLDGCEPVVAPLAPLVRTVLRDCPRVRVAATSRETLAIDGEATIEVRPLSLPEHAAVPSAEEAMRYEAIRLFVERAQLARAGFALGQREVSAVIEVCRRLDGLPLAIELAAAQLRTLSLAQLSSRLDRTAASPQRRLAAAFDASFRHLRSVERVLFRRLGVFRGSFDLEAVEAIASGGELHIEEVSDILWRLVEKSLVRAWPGDDGTIRFAILDTIREYALRHLGDAGELGEIQERHAGHLLALDRSSS